MPRLRSIVLAASASALALPAGVATAASAAPPSAPFLHPSTPFPNPPGLNDRVQYDLIPSDPIFSGNFKFDDGTPMNWHFTKANFPAAWDVASGRGVNVAVIDSEFDTSNPDLSEKLLVRYNAANSTQGYRTSAVKAIAGDTFHGTHVAGLAGARTDNGLGTGGACLDCGLVGIKVGSVGDPAGTSLGAKTIGDMVEAIDFAIAQPGVRVISMSLGFQRHYPELEAAVNRAIAANIVVVGSAGNSQQTAQSGQPNYPASYPPVIAVGATDKDDQIAEFSTQGSFVDVVAPGKRIVSTTDQNDPQLGGTFDQGGTQVALGEKSGTSMSTPIVAGLVALMLSVRSDLTPAEVDALLKQSARDLGNPGPDPIYGAGRIDALAAVNAAKAYVRPAPPADPVVVPPPVVAPPVAKPAPKVVRPTLGTSALKAKGTSVSVLVKRGTVASTVTIALRSKKKYASKGKKRYVVLAPSRKVKIKAGSGNQVVKLKLSGPGRTLLKRQPKKTGLKVLLTMTPKVKSNPASFRTLTLRR